MDISDITMHSHVHKCPRKNRPSTRTRAALSCAGNFLGDVSPHAVVLLDAGYMGRRKCVSSMDGHALGASTGRALGARVLQARFLQTTAVAGVAHPFPHSIADSLVARFPRHLSLVSLREVVRVRLLMLRIRLRRLVCLLRILLSLLVRLLRVLLRRLVMLLRVLLSLLVPLLRVLLIRRWGRRLRCGDTREGKLRYLVEHFHDALGSVLFVPCGVPVHARFFGAPRTVEHRSVLGLVDVSRDSPTCDAIQRVMAHCRVHTRHTDLQILALAQQPCAKSVTRRDVVPRQTGTSRRGHPYCASNTCFNSYPDNFAVAPAKLMECMPTKRSQARATVDAFSVSLSVSPDLPS